MFSSLLTDIGLYALLLLGFMAFVAGVLDAVVGGGGLIQLPAMLIQMPQVPVPQILGTNKMAAFAGTLVSAWQYGKRIRFAMILLICTGLAAAASSFAGARLITLFNPSLLKPLIFCLLVLMALYTWQKKDLGAAAHKQLPLRMQCFRGMALGLGVGFYDGFFGPGTGSFLVLGFVVWLGFPFLKASAYAKAVNCITNASALLVFVTQGQYILPVAMLMGACNMAGNVLGSRLALKRGNGFIRKVFLGILCLLIVRYGYDLLRQWGVLASR